jgi:hypothetical protein
MPTCVRRKLRATVTRRRPVYEVSRPARVTRFANPGLPALLVLYANLWIIEGALRKWIAPGLSGQLYFFRDASTVLLLAWILMARRSNIRTKGTPGAAAPILKCLLAWLVMCVSALALQLTVNNRDLTISFVGLLSYLAPTIPVVIALLVEPDQWSELLRLLRGSILLWLPLQALLIAVQTNSPARSIWNATGADSFASLTTANGVVRASGTFSAPSGLAAYLALVLVLLLVQKSPVSPQSRPIASAWWLMLLLGIALCGARTVLLQSAAAVLIAALARGLAGSKGVRFLLLASTVAATAAALTYAAFPAVVGSFLQRIAVANASESAPSRVAQSLFGYWETYYSTPWLGDGMGSHSQAGIALGSSLPWVEDELSRWVAELGYLGLVLALLRQLAVVGVFISLLARCSRRKSPELDWRTTAVFGSALPVLLFGHATTQPSLQGYVGLIGVLLICLQAAPRAVLPIPQVDATKAGRSE